MYADLPCAKLCTYKPMVLYSLFSFLQGTNFRKLHLTYSFQNLKYHFDKITFLFLKKNECSCFSSKVCSHKN